MDTSYLITSNSFRSRAADFALKALTSGFIEQHELDDIKSCMVRAITGSSITLKRNNKQKHQQLISHFKSIANQFPYQHLEHNCKLFAEGLQLPSYAWKVIELIVVLKANHGLSEFIEQLIPKEDYANAMYAQMIGIEELELVNFMLTLNAMGLFDTFNYVFNESTFFPPSVIQRISKEKADSYGELIEPIVQIEPCSALTLKDFDYLDIDNMQQFLDIAVNQSMEGVNLLLWGAPGVGKSELAKVLADSISASLISIKPVGDDVYYQAQSLNNKTPGSLLRLQYQKLVEKLVSQEERNILIFDECEQVFQDATSHNGVGKDLLHCLMERNLTPTIWITNYVERLPESVLRRFTFIRQINVPDNRILEAQLNKASKGLRLSKGFKKKFTAREHITPAHISNTTLVSHCLALTGKQAEENITAMVDENLLACGHDIAPLKFKAYLPFSMDHLNIQGGNHVIEQLEKAVSQQSGLRTLLFGVPGTGKSCLVNHLAKKANRELITVRSSDILGKYVGESERNCKAIFNQAHQQNAILFLDEADSLLSSRESLSNQYERQLVNEFLTQIDQSDVSIFAATNAAQMLDPAILRRYDYKLTLDYLTQKQVQNLYREIFGDINKELKAKLSRLSFLTAGDFSLVARRNSLGLYLKPLSHEQNIQLLTEENNRKQPNQTIGFVH